MYGSLFFAWPSSGRRQCLLDSLESLASNVEDHAHDTVFLVASDGPSMGLAPDLAEGLKDIEARYGIRIGLSNLESRREAIAGLSGRADRELIEYALLPCLDGPGWGVNVNVSMLASAGRFLVSTDDDVFCRPARSRTGKGAMAGGDASDLAFSKAYQNGDLLYYPSREALLASMEEVEVDVIGSYKRLLETREEGRVLAACPGMYGDSAMGSARSKLSLEGPSREALMAGGYEALRLSKELVRIAPRTTLSTSPQLIMTQTAFDNRVPLPPFLPYGRNPDGLCAVLTRLVYPDSLTAYLDFGLLHAPPEPRAHVRADLVGYRPGLAELMMALAIACRPDSGVTEPAERFRALGDTLGGLAGLRNTDLVEAIHASWSLQLTSYVERLESLLERYGRSPEAWALDVDEHIEAVNGYLREPSALFGPNGCGLPIDGVRRHLRLYGGLLAIWPELHALYAGGNGRV